MTIRNAISKNLYAALHANGLTPAELGRRTGVRAATIGNWLREDFMPSLDLLTIVCKELNLKVDDLLKGVDEW